MNTESKELSVARSKFVFENFEEAIKNPKFTFKEPEFNEDGEINMHWELVEIEHDQGEE